MKFSETFTDAQNRVLADLHQRDMQERQARASWSPLTECLAHRALRAQNRRDHSNIITSTSIPWCVGVMEYWSVGAEEVTAILCEQEMAILISLNRSKKTGHHPQIQYSTTPRAYGMTVNHFPHVYTSWVRSVESVDVER